MSIASGESAVCLPHAARHGAGGHGDFGESASEAGSLRGCFRVP